MLDKLDRFPQVDPSSVKKVRNKPMTDPWDERYIYLLIYHKNQPFIYS